MIITDESSKRRRVGALVALVCLVVAIFAVELGQTRGVEEDAALEEFTSHLDARVPALMDHFGIPGAVIAIVDNGEPVWSQAYGLADVEAARPMTTDTRCRVESISKSVTAWGVMRLVEQGEIALDDPVAPHLGNWELPESDFSSEQVTIRRLLSHTAGMPLGDIFERYSPDEDILTLSESLAEKAVLEREPGSFFSYSNTGFDLLELMVEKTTGRDFAEYMRDEVLIPLGMNDSSFTWREDFDPPIPNGHDQTGQPVPVYVYPATASGGLFAIVDDIARFVAALMTDLNDTGKAVLSSESIAALYRPVADTTSFYQMGKIILARSILLALIGVIVIVALLRLWQLVHGFASRKRRFAPFARDGSVLRLAQGSLAIALFLGVLWCSSREYLFLTSVFPVASGWFWVTVSGFGATLLLSSLVPENA